ncbi:MAG TPA: A/G-specific adenine glycosylase [Candidatus Acidoferrum sp.]|nr:A/G-specific adenine glycosylase [Candidatus Acidoferrum sp.]
MARQLLEWFGQNARDLPWRRTQDPYAIWMAEIMLQQTQVKTVAAYWQRWMRALPDARAFARAKSAQVHKLWEGLGYYARVRNAHAAARVMAEKHGGEFPRTFAEALALPGVGRYTAGAVCSIAYNHPTAVLDGNVTRVLSRVFGVGGEPRGKKANARLWSLAEELVSIAQGLPSPGPAKADRFSPAPKPQKTARIFCAAKAAPGGADSERPPRGNCGRLNEALMELGALICKPKQPACPACPLRRVCFARAANRVAEFPRAKAPVRAERRRFLAFIVNRKGRLLARQRPAGGVNALLWEFPNVEIAPEEKNPAAAAAPFVLTATKPVCRVRHSIMRHRILLEACRARWPGPPGKGVAPGVWRTPAQLERLAFTSAHRKVLAALQDEIKLEKRTVRT